MERFQFEKGGDREERNREEADNFELHSADLFDQDEDVAGERNDVATGEQIDNSSYNGMEDLTEFNPDDEGLDDEMKDDEAARWLREHGKGLD